MSLSQLIESVIDKKLRAIPQHLICTIESFDKDKQTATCKPLYKSVDAENKEIDYPLLSNIPVMSCYLGKDISVIPSYERGDLVLVACSTFDYSKQLKKQSAKESEGLFGLENSFVIGGIKSSGDTTKDLQISFEDDKILFKNKTNEMEVNVNDFKVKKEIKHPSGRTAFSDGFMTAFGPTVSVIPNLHPVP